MRRSLVGLGMVGALLGPASALAEDDKPEQAAQVTNAVVDLSSVEQVKALCLATRPTSRVYFSGDSVEQGKAKQEYVAARKAAMKQLYRTSIPASGFKLGEYRPKDNSLELDLSRAPRTLYGALTLAVPTQPAVKFQMTPQQVKDAQAAMRAGTATLVSYFELSDEQGAVCSGSAAAGVFSATVTPVAFDLRDGMGQLLGRTETPRADQHRALLGGYSGVPTVAFGAVEGENTDVNAVAKRLSPAVESLKGCYVERLKTRPDAGGTAVLGIAVEADGHVDSVSFIADALRDEPLRKCVDENVKSLKFGGITGLPGLFRVPVEFQLAHSK